MDVSPWCVTKHSRSLMAQPVQLYYHPISQVRKMRVVGRVDLICFTALSLCRYLRRSCWDPFGKERDRFNEGRAEIGSLSQNQSTI